MIFSHGAQMIFTLHQRGKILTFLRQYIRLMHAVLLFLVQSGRLRQNIESHSGGALKRTLPLQIETQGGRRGKIYGRQGSLGKYQ